MYTATERMAVVFGRVLETLGSRVSIQLVVRPSVVVFGRVLETLGSRVSIQLVVRPSVLRHRVSASTLCPLG